MTFAGADISGGGSVEILPASEAPDSQPTRVVESMMPVAMVYDPRLFESTPMGALASPR